MSNEMVPLADQVKKAELMAQASLLPEAYKKQPANLLWAMEMADALNVSLAQAITGISVINGKPSMSAEMMRGLVARAGHRFRVVEMSDKAAVVEVARREWPEDVQAFTFTMDDAAKAGLAGSATYKRHPKAMLLARATSMACRAVFADVVSGMGYTPDELGGEPQPHHTPAAPSPARLIAHPAEPDAQVDTGSGEVIDAEVIEDDTPQLEEEPSADDTAEAVEPITVGQKKTLAGLLRECGFGKPEALAFYEQVTQREVAATADLERGEADAVIAELTSLLQGEDPAA